MNTSAMTSAVQRISPNFLAVNLDASFYERIHICIEHESGVPKISLWEELNSGNNYISIDVSALTRGNYSFTVSDKLGSTKLSEMIRL